MKLGLAVIFMALCSKAAKTKPKAYYLTSVSIFCTDVNEKYVENVKCFIRAQRGKRGLINVRWDYVNVTTAYWEVKYFYRPLTAAQHFQPYLVDVDFSVCFDKTPKSNPLVELIMNIFSVIDPTIGICPKVGTLKMADFDLDEVVERFFPPFWPQGRYLGVYRFHSENNETYLTIKHQANIKSKGLIDLSMLNMG